MCEVWVESNGEGHQWGGNGRRGAKEREEMHRQQRRDMQEVIVGGKRD